MIEMFLDIQREILDRILEQNPGNHQYSADLHLISRTIDGEETRQAKQLRIAAEGRVLDVVLQHGEEIGHGDLLTFQKVRQAILMQSTATTAIDRLEYIGAFRIQLFHLTMAKCAMDTRAAMPDPNMYEDPGSLAHSAALMGITDWFTNEKKSIVRCGNFERHAQHLEAVQQALLHNMFNNYLKVRKVDVSKVRTRAEVEKLLSDMFDHYGIRWWWDPEAVDPMSDVECKLFLSSKDQVVRLILDLAFKQAERENDAVALRALRRVMIIAFRSSSSRSKYALYTLVDLVSSLISSLFDHMIDLRFLS